MTSLGTALKTSDLFVKALENEGVEYIFAVPGEALPLPCCMAALLKSLITTVHVAAQGRRTWIWWSPCAHPASSSSWCGTSKQVMPGHAVLLRRMHACMAR